MHKKGDFHIHTNASDGKLSPKEIVKAASDKDFDIISITDHDTIDGLEDALSTAKDYNLKVIPGIELSTLHNGESIHILGYFKDDSYKHSEFKTFLSDLQNSRVLRAKRIVENLDHYFNIKLNYEKILKDAEGVVARPHIAKAIIEAGYDYDWNYIFDNIISKDSPAYVPYKKITIPEGIELLKKYNAVVVLAHPVLINNSNLEDLMKFDFDGIEAIYPLNNQEETEKFISIAKKYNKFITAGSDYHGQGKIDTKHGDMGLVSLTGENLQIFLSNFFF